MVIVSPLLKTISKFGIFQVNASCAGTGGNPQFVSVSLPANTVITNTSTGAGLLQGSQGQTITLSSLPQSAIVSSSGMNSSLYNKRSKSYILQSIGMAVQKRNFGIFFYLSTNFISAPSSIVAVQIECSLLKFNQQDLNLLNK